MNGTAVAVMKNRPIAIGIAFLCALAAYFLVVCALCVVERIGRTA